MLKVFLTCWVLLLLPGSSMAAEITLNDVVQTLETPFKSETPGGEKIGDFQADFYQQSHLVSIDRTQKGHGTVQFKFTATADHAAVAKFHWIYQAPAAQEIISDGKTMWVYLPENRQVIESDISQIHADQGANPVTFLSDLGHLSRNFKTSWDSPRETTSGHYRLLLVPLETSAFIDKIAITIHKDAVYLWRNKHKTGEIFPILATLVTDPSGNQTAIEFRDVKINQQLNDPLFTFIRPPGVEVVDPGQQLGF